MATITRLAGLSTTTVQKYLAAGHFPERQAQPVGSKALRPFTAYLDRRWAEGCHTAQQLWREICGQGYDRSPRAVLIYVAHLRQGLPTYTTEPTTARPTTRRFSPWQAARLWTTFPDKLSSADQTDLLALRQAHPQLEQAYQLAQAFIIMVHHRQPDALQPWLHAALNSSLTPFQTFATGLHRDKAAVLAALVLPWSNGQVEGQINRLKTLKRQMYGRAKFDCCASEFYCGADRCLSEADRLVHPAFRVIAPRHGFISQIMLTPCRFNASHDGNLFGLVVEVEDVVTGHGQQVGHVHTILTDL